MHDAVCKILKKHMYARVLSAGAWAGLTARHARSHLQGMSCLVVEPTEVDISASVQLPDQPFHVRCVPCWVIAWLFSKRRFENHIALLFAVFETPV